MSVEIFFRGAIAFLVAAMLSSVGPDCMAGWRRGRCGAVPAVCPQHGDVAPCGTGSASVRRHPTLAEPAPPNREPTLAPPRAPSAAQGDSLHQEGAVVHVTVEVASPGKN